MTCGGRIGHSVEFRVSGGSFTMAWVLPGLSKPNGQTRCDESLGRRPPFTLGEGGAVGLPFTLSEGGAAGLPFTLGEGGAAVGPARVDDSGSRAPTLFPKASLKSRSVCSFLPSLLRTSALSRARRSTLHFCFWASFASRSVAPV